MMRIVGLLMVRNEDWIIRASLRAALAWCDAVVVLHHVCTDNTGSIVKDTISLDSDRIKALHTIWYDASEQHWDEMMLRDRMLRVARERFDATHFALIDADEMPTANVIPRLRGLCDNLVHGQVLDLPMIPVWGDLDHYRHDASVWSGSMLSVAVRDTADRTLTHQPQEDGYQHHNRVPTGVHGRYAPWTDKSKHGGIMHVQFANRRRLLAKHVLYRMVDHLRWPGRETVAQLNRKYDQALDETGIIRLPIPPEWWAGLARDSIRLDGIPWQEEVIRKLISQYGLTTFEGLDLKGFSMPAERLGVSDENQGKEW